MVKWHRIAADPFSRDGRFPEGAPPVPLRPDRCPVAADRPFLATPLPPWPGQPPRKDHRPLLNGILWHLHTGAPWPDTPERYGPRQTVYDRFNRWRKDGTWAKILHALLLRLDRAGLIDRDRWCFDGTVSRAHVSAAGAKKKPARAPRLGGKGLTQLPEPEGHALGRSRGGFRTKTHLVCDRHGILLAVWVTAGPG